MASKRLRLEMPEPEPLPWPRVRELGLGGKGRRLASLALRPEGTTRSAVARDAAFRAAANLTPSFAVEVDGVRIYVETADEEISRLVYIFGLYDKPLMTLVFSALAQLGDAADLEGARLLDVGANIGTTTLTAIACFGAAGAYAFEPDPANYRNLAVNLAANGLGDAVTAFPLALSDAGGTASLERSPVNAGDHRLRAGSSSATDTGDRETVTVRTAALDDLVVAGEVDLDRVGLAWIDVQGHEAHVLAGATALLERELPLVAEYWPDGLAAAGGLERFNALVAETFAGVLDLGGPGGTPNPDVLPANEVAAIGERLAGSGTHTDLLLLPGRLT